MGIVAHTLVKNEERFVWFAINSVIDCVDEMRVWDNGSSDSTVKIIKSIKNSKITFKDASGVRPEVARQRMLDETKSDWIFILDGDEIWYEPSIEYLISNIQSNIDCVVVPNYMLIGDIFHYQEEKAGRYKIAGRVGHYNIRAVKNSPGLHLEGVYPNEAFVTKEGVKVQNLPEEKILFLDKPYLHASFLKKNKYEIGEEFAPDFYYPEVFFKDRPDFVPSPWRPMAVRYKLKAFFETPLKKIKRRII